MNTQAIVKGYKQVYTNNKVTVYSDGKNAEVIFNGSVTSNASEYIIGNVGSYVPLFDTSTNYQDSTSTADTDCFNNSCIEEFPTIARPIFVLIKSSTS